MKGCVSITSTHVCTQRERVYPALAAVAKHSQLIRLRIHSTLWSLPSQSLSHTNSKMSNTSSDMPLGLEWSQNGSVFHQKTTYSWNSIATQFVHKHPKAKWMQLLLLSWETREALVRKEVGTEYSLTKPTSGLCWILFLVKVYTLDLADTTKIHKSVHYRF